MQILFSGLVHILYIQQFLFFHNSANELEVAYAYMISGHMFASGRNNVVLGSVCIKIMISFLFFYYVCLR